MVKIGENKLWNGKKYIKIVMHLCIYVRAWACMYLNFFGSKEIYIFDINYNWVVIRLDFKGMIRCSCRSFSLFRLIEAEQKYGKNCTNILNSYKILLINNKVSL